MADLSNTFIISVMAHDCIGIVAAVSGAISDLGGDIADLRQSVLRGYFTMILLASFPEHVTAQMIQHTLSSIDRAGLPRLEIAVRRAKAITPAQKEGAMDSAYVLTASGEDRIGFVASVSTFCADHQINILDLATVVDGGTYIMMLLVDLGRCDVADVRHDLERFARQTGLNVVLQHYDIFRATYEVGLL